ncbi:pore-forming ESAT-6 family protein [Bosea sp. 685]|uniref:pore-forming ESAT-6 family protein n=1 Tax=Bosea sp. 685 TaxID=3080057 RepID=UPI00289347B3|nr:pore-forming ESAT-6 family protein [Bosea sp. 685]WNJ93289.1 pore-forming ESAT-6 family protein [Bosea sp. 685]
MTSPKNFIYIVAASAFLASGASALAQTPTQADQLKLAYQAGRNQLGILSYCNDKGFVGSDVIDIQKKLLGMVPVPADKSGGDAAEAQGRTGTIAAMGIQQNIEAIAKAQNATAETYCKQIGAVITQMGAALPK